MAVDNQTYLNYSLIAASAVLAWILSQFFAFAIITAKLTPYLGTWKEITPLFMGIMSGVIAFTITKRHPAINRFGTEVVVELRKVTWPTRKEVTSATGAVLIVIFICAVILYLFDKLFDLFIGFLMGL